MARSATIKPIEQRAGLALRIDSTISLLPITEAQNTARLACSLRDEGLKQKEIAERLGVSQPTAQRILARNGYMGYSAFHKDNQKEQLARIIELRGKGEKCETIASELGLSATYISRKLRQNGIKARERAFSVMPQKLMAQIKKMCRAGKSLDAIADKLSISRSAVYAHRA